MFKKKTKKRGAPESRGARFEAIGKIGLKPALDIASNDVNCVFSLSCYGRVISHVVNSIEQREAAANVMIVVFKVAQLSRC